MKLMSSLTVAKIEDNSTQLLFLNNKSNSLVFKSKIISKQKITSKHFILKF